ncbi:MAG: type III-B CRISPR-associated protein Cas10/Cmr2 [Leptolyngbya foveolarum]|uniref:Type III-B CRISPR-associated protein Cas10/Cmr2 n=1 Tax=Leptolyngbya foveolarum TaxID=47253 RepID=A0A2W4TVF6_9CYAN|nr:MAG: type III-B CRISPR-associated protein Cas10/Cmr2 [Leptolyngbya foveolarum]
MNRYHYKLYALLNSSDRTAPLALELACLDPHLPRLDDWWKHESFAASVASDADRINLDRLAQNPTNTTVCHPISGQTQTVSAARYPLTKAFIAEKLGSKIANEIFSQTDEETVFWWFWRFSPMLAAAQDPEALLHPQHSVLPDCSVHSYQSTVSAIAGAACNNEATEAETPYLLIFSFSPVQEFIKSSRKFLDFWAGSYLLHYLSAQLCWKIASGFEASEGKEEIPGYGPDSIVVPSLWSQEIIDALLLEDVDKQSLFQRTFEQLGDRSTPVQRFKAKSSNSLSTAGFPNMITVLVPGEAAAKALGDRLSKELTALWKEIGTTVRDDIRDRVLAYLHKASNRDKAALLKEVFPGIAEQDLSAYMGGSVRDDGTFKKGDLEKLAIQSCWEWKELWEAQLENAWEPYWSAVPLGHPQTSLVIKGTGSDFEEWVQKQWEIAHSPRSTQIPNEPERALSKQLAQGEFNVGSWWGSLQRRLQICLQATKTTRTWQIPAAPGDRSTISGRFSALHPWLNYKANFREGGGLPEGSLRLFWAVMAKAYPGLFNGVERLNAIETTKRMAWNYGGMAESLGIPSKDLEVGLSSRVKAEDLAAAESGAKEKNEYDFETKIRFPNLSSIAAARFIKDSPELAKDYWTALMQNMGAVKDLSSENRRAFYAKTLRDSQILTVDKAVREAFPQYDSAYNGVMFSSKWLADDMGLTLEERTGQGSKLSDVRNAVDAAHNSTGLMNGSPADWWVIVLADGDNMGQFVSGKKLKKYECYVQRDALNESALTGDTLDNFLQQTTKRMGPATHVGLNRALLDFSNQLVPYLTERRYCGRVIYSGGDDVMAVLPLEDLPGYLRSLRAAWSGQPDPKGEFETAGGYWRPKSDRAKDSLPNRPLFTMGETATMSIGVVIAHKSVPLPTVLESLWDAEGKQAKGMPGKNGLCFRVMYGNGNQLEALMSGGGIASVENANSSLEENRTSADLFSRWWDWVGRYEDYGDKLSPVLYRLSEELPKRAAVGDQLLAKAAQVIVNRRDSAEDLAVVNNALVIWIEQWENWAITAKACPTQSNLGTESADLGKLLRFSAFWIDKRVERLGWANAGRAMAETTTKTTEEGLNVLV